MNELREKINDNLQGVWGGAINISTNEDCRLANGQIDENKYLKVKINTLAHFNDAILDAVIAALPGEDRAIDVASDEDERYAFHTAKNAYMSAIEETKSLLQAAKENK